MNPNMGENQQQFEAAPRPEDGEQAGNRAVEKSPVKSPENSPQSLSVGVSSQAAQAAATPSQTVADGFTATDDAQSGRAPQTVVADAADTDRIEKEWVDKAKSVINQTKDDPYEQKNEISKVKADYIQKRFNRSLKTDDAVAK